MKLNTWTRKMRVNDRNVFLVNQNQSTCLNSLEEQKKKTEEEDFPFVSIVFIKEKGTSNILSNNHMQKEKSLN